MSDVFLSSAELLTEKHSGGHKQLKEDIIAMRSALKQAMDAGLTPADMTVASALSEAVEAADNAVDKMYAKLAG